jgi:hypothetical protein
MAAGLKGRENYPSILYPHPIYFLSLIHSIIPSDIIPPLYMHPFVSVIREMGKFVKRSAGSCWKA